MSMLTLNGILQNVFEKPEGKNRETGEIIPASTQAQILAENILEGGEKRLEMVTLKVHAADTFRKLEGQYLRVPVGAFARDGKIQYYALKTEPLPLLNV